MRRSEYLSPKQVRTELGITRYQWRAMVKLGLPVSVLGHRTYRVRRDKLNEFLDRLAEERRENERRT